MPELKMPRKASTDCINRVINASPVGTLIKVKYVESLDTLDIGYDLDDEDPEGQLAVITTWSTENAFTRDDGVTIVYFECLWDGMLVGSSNYAMTRVISTP